MLHSGSSKSEVESISANGSEASNSLMESMSFLVLKGGALQGGHKVVFLGEQVLRLISGRYRSIRVDTGRMYQPYHSRKISMF